MAKIHYSSRLDSTLTDCKVQFSLAGALLYYMEDLDKRNGDYDQYKTFVKNAKLSADAAVADRTAKNSGIVTAPASALRGFGAPSGRVPGRY